MRGGRAATQTRRKRLIIDTDAGIDDAIAILMAFKHLPENSVEAITTVFGNVCTHQANHNIRRILKECKNADAVTVHSGAHAPILSSVASPWPGHGPDGLGNFTELLCVSCRRHGFLTRHFLDRGLGWNLRGV